jgi:ABC-type glycerol-3-phosphate transport system permease component
MIWPRSSPTGRLARRARSGDGTPTAFFNGTATGILSGTVRPISLEADAVIAMVPCLLLFLIRQRHYVRGLLAGATKG